jgi:hypothetical protein
MAAVLYKCPAIGIRVQGWIAEEASGEDTYFPLQCIACKQMHYVNPATGRVIGGTWSREHHGAPHRGQ